MTLIKNSKLIVISIILASLTLFIYEPEHPDNLSKVSENPEEFLNESIIVQANIGKIMKPTEDSSVEFFNASSVNEYENKITVSRNSNSCQNLNSSMNNISIQGEINYYNTCECEGKKVLYDYNQINESYSNWKTTGTTSYTKRMRRGLCKSLSDSREPIKEIEDSSNWDDETGKPKPWYNGCIKGSTQIKYHLTCNQANITGKVAINETNSTQ